MRPTVFCILVYIFFGFEFYSQQNNQVSSFNPLDIPVSNQDDIWSLDFAPAVWLNSTNAPSAHKFSFSTGLTYHYEPEFDLKQSHLIRVFYIKFYGWFLREKTIGNQT